MPVPYRSSANSRSIPSLFQDRANLLDRQHHGPLRSHGVNVADLNFQDLAIKKRKRRKRLILRAGGNVAIDDEMCEKRLDLGRPQLARMALAVKKDLAQDPRPAALPRPTRPRAIS